MWEAGRTTWAIATDDIHSDNHFQKGWVMIKSPSLEMTNILQALKEDMFYSSMGLEIYDVKLIGRKVYIECSPVRKVYCIGARYRETFYELICIYSRSIVSFHSRILECIGKEMRRQSIVRMA